MKKFVLLIVTLLVPFRASAAISEPERNQKIDLALFYHYSGKPVEARKEAEELRDTFPDEPFFRELIAEIIWGELSKLLLANPGEESIDVESVRNNPHAQYLSERFKEEAFAGLALTQGALENNPNDPKNIFLRAMLKLRYAGFIVKFEAGLKSYTESDREMAEALVLIKKSVGLDPTLCSVKYAFALSKHIMIRVASDALYKRGIIMWKSRIYNELGRNFDRGDVFRWLEESRSCASTHWWTKDIEIDKKLVYQDILVKQAGRMDDLVLPVLEELNRKFPENKEVRDNLFLVRLHIQNRSRSSR